MRTFWVLLALTVLGLTETFVDMFLAFWLLVVLVCGGCIVALIVRQSRLERSWYEADRRRSDRMYAKCHKAGKPTK